MDYRGFSPIVLSTGAVLTIGDNNKSPTARLSTDTYVIAQIESHVATSHDQRSTRFLEILLFAREC